MSRRAVGASRFDIIAQDAAGAWDLWLLIHKDYAKFRDSHSLYIQASVEGFDDFTDDQWAMALEAIRPGNVPHSLKVIKIELVGSAQFEAYSPTMLSSSGTQNASRSPSLGGAAAFLSERAFIKALFNIRGVEHVEISGPMQAQLKKQLTVAMTTRPGRRVRAWQRGGGLRTDDDIAWGTWAAAMQPSDEIDATACESISFASQTCVARQPMQIAVNANFAPNRLPTLTPLAPVSSFTRPTLPLFDEDSDATETDGTETVHGQYMSAATIQDTAVVQQQEQSGQGDGETANWADGEDIAVPSDYMDDGGYEDVEE